MIQDRPYQLKRLLSATPLWVFTGVALLLWFAHGNRLLLGTNDEGIYLEGARRILAGQKPYVDFWASMTPGSFWIQALVFKLFGVTMTAGRLPVILDFSLQCALVYWLTSILASRMAALATLFLFFGFQTADLSFLTAQHRWDSSAISLAGVALCVQGLRKRKALWFLASGLTLAASVSVTPSLVLVAGITFIWLAARRELRSFRGWYLCGGIVGGSVILGVLLAQGVFWALAREMQGLIRNYGALNTVPYGAIIGGYSTLFTEASIIDWAVRGLIVLGVALPAVLPVISVAGWIAVAVAGRARNENRMVIPYLVLCVAGFAASTYPRPDVMHLAWVVPLAYVMTGALIYHHIPTRLGMPLWWGFAGMAAVFLWYSGSRLVGEQRLLTPVGTVRIGTRDKTEVQSLLDQVHAGAGLFVYPNKALLYFLTQTRNPTGVPFTMPGMGVQVEEALKNLQNNPPEWILYLDITMQEFQRVFPALRELDPHCEKLESWIKSHYAPSGDCSVSGYRLMRRN
jgi:4-amino-4-deoxy-L-arabinose transferase-like glycosyltransferase